MTSSSSGESSSSFSSPFASPSCSSSFSSSSSSSPSFSSSSSLSSSFPLDVLEQRIADVEQEIKFVEEKIKKAELNIELFELARARIASFFVGVGVAGSFAIYQLRQDVWESHRVLAEQAKTADAALQHRVAALESALAENKGHDSDHVSQGGCDPRGG